MIPLSGARRPPVVAGYSPDSRRVLVLSISTNTGCSSPAAVDHLSKSPVPVNAFVNRVYRVTLGTSAAGQRLKDRLERNGEGSVICDGSEKPWTRASWVGDGARNLKVTAVGLLKPPRLYSRPFQNY